MIFKNTKLLILSFLQSKYAIYVLCLLSFSEAIFFTIPPYLLLIHLAVINYKKVLQLDPNNFISYQNLLAAYENSNQIDNFQKTLKDLPSPQYRPTALS